MKIVVCSGCGASDFIEKNGFLVCTYCCSKFAAENDDKPIYSAIKKNTAGSLNDSNSSIALSDDVQRLLDKCKKEPLNAKRYANLILDIDPDNIEALNYL